MMYMKLAAHCVCLAVDVISGVSYKHYLDHTHHTSGFLDGDVLTSGRGLDVCRNQAVSQSLVRNAQRTIFRQARRALSTLVLLCGTVREPLEVSDQLTDHCNATQGLCLCGDGRREANSL
jgi:hypothetical protein